ncbi:NUDIX domain-containing protein [Kutzneria sp. NPDC052558]|uniref:NUDIX domain-containing protein n=1 Tax=Kutzneria sp. NPDC052558 TaxID=3364121 RepID=UPI0037C64D0E
MADELIALYSPAGEDVGSVSRARMRAEGLWHAATVIVVRSGDGARVYVHRRSPDKDVFPGLRDAAAGGVVAAGEDPDVGAERELAEELGITGAPLRFLYRFVYDEPPVRCHNFVYETSWDGPIVHQPEEIVSGEWMPLAEVAALLRDPASDFVPDGRAIALEWLRRYYD